MKRCLLLIAALAALALGVNAQDVSLESVYKSLPSTAKVSPAAAPAPAAPVAPAAAASPAAAEREWLVLVFINGVNDLGLLGSAKNDINEMEAVGSTDKMAVLVEFSMLDQDGSMARNLEFQGGSKTLVITRDSDATRINSTVINTTPNADMGSPVTLVRFVKRALRNNYKAKKTALIIWNHGAGRLGISSDDVSGSKMEVDALGAALAEINKALGRKIDVLATDACLMQMASVAYEWKDYADVIVGSQEEIQLPGYPYTEILGRLAADPSIGSEQLGRVIVDAFLASYPTDATLSALRASALDGFRGALDNWVYAVKTDRKAFEAASNAALLRSVSRFSVEDSKDLVDYVDKVGAAPGVGGQVKGAGEALKAFISGGLLIHNGSKPAGNKRYTRAGGLAIYVPKLNYDSRNYGRFAFAAESLWDDFLLESVEARLK